MPTSPNKRLLTKIMLPGIANGNRRRSSRPQPMTPAQAQAATPWMMMNDAHCRGARIVGGSPPWSGPSQRHRVYGTRPRRKLPAKPKADPGLKVPPMRSPIRFPMAMPQAAAGPNSRLKAGGRARAGRSSVNPGISGIGLNGIRTAA